MQLARIWYPAQKAGSGTVLPIATLAGMLPQVMIVESQRADQMSEQETAGPLRVSRLVQTTRHIK